MTYTKISLTIMGISIFSIVFLFLFSSVLFYKWHIYDPVKLTGEELDAKREEFGQRYLNWAVRETIKYDYEECKTINRTKPINRLLKRDYMLPMCPSTKVMLYDELQKMVFIFNEDSKEMGSVLTIDTINASI